MCAKRPKVVPISNPTLFEMGKLEQSGNLMGRLEVERPYSDPNILLGTSAFTAKGWPGSFYPTGMKPANYLSHYAKTFRTVEIDSTFYATPSVSTVNSWYEKTPADIAFSEAAPIITAEAK